MDSSSRGDATTLWGGEPLWESKQDGAYRTVVGGPKPIALYDHSLNLFVKPL